MNIERIYDSGMTYTSQNLLNDNFTTIESTIEEHRLCLRSLTDLITQQDKEINQLQEETSRMINILTNQTTLLTKIVALTNNK